MKRLGERRDVKANGPAHDKPPVRPTRQAALHAKESLSAHSASHFSMKRRRHHRATSKDPKDLAWLESQLGDAIALAMTRELVNNWDRFSKPSVCLPV